MLQPISTTSKMWWVIKNPPKAAAATLCEHRLRYSRSVKKWLVWVNGFNDRSLWLEDTQQMGDIFPFVLSTSGILWAPFSAFFFYILCDYVVEEALFLSCSSRPCQNKWSMVPRLPAILARDFISRRRLNFERSVLCFHNPPLKVREIKLIFIRSVIWPTRVREK